MAINGNAVASGVGELLECLPMESVEFAFAYGSGAFAQTGEGTLDKMVDFVVVTRDPLRFHEENLRRNPSHYSAVRHLGARGLANFQCNFAARVFYNTQVRYKGRLLKYGVVDGDDLQRDLLDWRWLYLAGRLHKPVLRVIQPSPSLLSAINENRKSAAQAALLLLPDTFSMHQFLSEIVALSYRGDFRMLFGEDKNKVAKIAEGSAEPLTRIYLPLLESDPRTIVRGHRVEQDLSTSAIYHRLQLLPSTVLEKLQLSSNQRDAKQRDIEEITHSLAHRLDAPEHISAAIESIVAHSALRQSLKNAVTAGFTRSALYSLTKLVKMLKSIRM